MSSFSLLPLRAAGKLLFTMVQSYLVRERCGLAWKVVFCPTLAGTIRKRLNQATNYAETKQLSIHDRD